MTDELHDIPSIEALLVESMASLLLRKTHLAFDLADIEGQLLERTDTEDELSGWRRKAKTKAHYLRRALAVVNNVISIKIEQRRAMWSDNDHGVSVLVAIHKLLRVWEAANALIEVDDDDDESRALDSLADAVQDAREVYFMVPSDG